MCRKVGIEVLLGMWDELVGTSTQGKEGFSNTVVCDFGMSGRLQ